MEDPGLRYAPIGPDQHLSRCKSHSAACDCAIEITPATTVSDRTCEPWIPLRACEFDGNWGTSTPTSSVTQRRPESYTACQIQNVDGSTCTAVEDAAFQGSAGVFTVAAARSATYCDPAHEPGSFYEVSGPGTNPEPCSSGAIVYTSKPQCAALTLCTSYSNNVEPQWEYRAPGVCRDQCKTGDAWKLVTLGNGNSRAVTDACELIRTPDGSDPGQSFKPLDACAVA